MTPPGGHAVQTFANAYMVGITVHRAPAMGIWLRGDGGTFYKVALWETGYATGADWMSWDGGASAIFNTVCISCEVLNTRGGGNGDGFKLGSFGGGNTTYIDCHAYECDDDGFDQWSSVASNFHHYGSAVRCGKNTIGTNLGDGNGYKLGGPTGSTIPQYLNQCVATNNGRTVGSGGCGLNANGSSTSIKHVLRLCTSTGNLNGNYYFSDTPDATRYTIESV